MFDILTLEAEARAQVAKETSEKAKSALVKKLRELEAARNIVRNVEREIEDIKASIADGSFTG
jgi:phage shock protein A